MVILKFRIEVKMITHMPIPHLSGPVKPKISSLFI